MIALATCEALPDLDPDDALLVAALRERGLDPRPAVWSDGAIDWSRFDAILIRTVWDYFLRPTEFLPWVERAAAAAPMWNPADVVRWNADKSYLRDLEEHGAATIPTAWIDRGSDADLATLLAELDWHDAILKPTVAGGSLGLHRIEDLDAAEAHLDGLLRTGDAMVQPFLPSIAGGELSILFVDGEPSHAVRKTPRPGDIRVQPEHGGIVTAAQPTAAEMAAGRRALTAAGRPLLYARADLVPGADGEPLLIELECIEPRLFLGHAPGAAERLADAFAAGL